MELLKNINKVEPSDYLFHHIQNRVQVLNSNEIAMSKVYAVAASIFLLISMNIMVVTQKNLPNNKSTLSIKTVNNFYDE